MTEPDMIERVARAICVSEKMNPDDKLGGWVHWVDAARAAVEAMRGMEQEIPMKDAHLCGEAISTSFFDRGMEWVDYSDASDRVETQSFLARWRARTGEDYDRLGYCMMDENGNIFILGTEAGKMIFRPAYDPDQVLVSATPSPRNASDIVEMRDVPSDQ